MSLRRNLEQLHDTARGMVDAEGKQIDPLALASELERILAAEDMRRRRVDRKYEHRIALWREARLESAKAVVSFGQAAVRAILLINGGAAIATLAFLGDAFDEVGEAAPLFARSLLFFCFGVALASIVAGVSYVTQFSYDQPGSWLGKYGGRLHLLAAFFGVLSIVVFGVGIWLSYQGLQYRIGS